MSKLFLTSYLAGTKNLVKEFLKDVPEKEITFVPTASNPEDYKRYVDEAKQAFLKLGFSINILDISKTEKQKIENILKDTKILYVSGGNVFYLLQELKRKKNFRYYQRQNIKWNALYRRIGWSGYYF